MKPTKFVAFALLASVVLAGCAGTTQGSPDSSDPARAAAAEAPATDPDSPVPAGLQTAAAGNGFAITPTASGSIPGLGSAQAYAVSKGSEQVGRIVIKPDQSTSKIAGLTSSLVGEVGQAGTAIPTDRGTFQVVRLPLGVAGVAGFDSTFVLLQAQTPEALKSLALVAQGV